jgi:hypothetical protein
MRDDLLMPRPASPITIRGVTYESVSAAAAAHGVTPGRVYQLRAQGRLDEAGELPRGPKVPHTAPVSIRGVRYESITAAAEALKVTPSAVSHAIRRKSLDSIGLWK